MTALAGLRAKRDALRESRHLDIEVPDIDGVLARFRPVSILEIQRETEKVEKATDKIAANVQMNARVLGACFIELRTADGTILSSGMSDEFLAEFCPNIDNPTQADAMLGLFTDDYPLFETGGKLADWSASRREAAEAELSGN